jgi:2-keto-4-pentenoate hydratase/2-oxohepta-3-ene-1,7-dioic acid hydratase in catechol pathway
VRLATIVEGGHPAVAIVLHDRCLTVATGDPGLDPSVRAIAASGPDGLGRLRAWADGQPAAAWRSLAALELGPAVADPGAIYTVGLNYLAPGQSRTDRGLPARPLIYGKAASSVAGPGVLTWDRALAPTVDPECELGVVIGAAAHAVDASEAMTHVFGFTCINDVSSRDPWLDGDQWLLGKSMPGFCPVGPWVVTPDELTPDDLRLGCIINGIAIQDDSTASMRFSIAEVIAYLSRHVTLRPGDLIATGTPARLAGPMGADRHLEAGDTVTVWIEGIGELTTTIA